MASDNQITIVGNLTDDPELRYTANGAAVANFRVAYSTRIRDAAGNWTDGDTSFFTVNCWRALAENAAETLTRGTRVVVTGRLKQRSWENQEGEKRTVIEIEADDLGPSLKWATATVQKTSRSSSASSSGGGGGGDWGAAVAPVGAGSSMDEETPLDAVANRGPGGPNAIRKRRPGRRRANASSASSARNGPSTSTTRTSSRFVSSSPSAARSARAV